MNQCDRLYLDGFLMLILLLLFFCRSSNQMTTEMSASWMPPVMSTRILVSRLGFDCVWLMRYAARSILTILFSIVVIHSHRSNCRGPTKRVHRTRGVLWWRWSSRTSKSIHQLGKSVKWHCWLGTIKIENNRDFVNMVQGRTDSFLDFRVQRCLLCSIWW